MLSPSVSPGLRTTIIQEPVFAAAQYTYDQQLGPQHYTTIALHKVTVTIRGRDLTALIDCGATSNFMHIDVAEQLKLLTSVSLAPVSFGDGKSETDVFGSKMTTVHYSPNVTSQELF